MPEISDRPTKISELMNLAAGQLRTLTETAAEEDKQAAFEAYRDVLRLIGRAHMASFDGRTAALTGLITELNEVTDAIQITSPVAAQLEKLAQITVRARSLFKEEKENE